MHTHRIVVEATAVRGTHGQRYRVHFEGAVLLEDCWSPEFEACRALAVRGVTGRLEVWRVGADYPGLIIRYIGAAAFRTVKENEKVGPRFAPWTPMADGLGQDAVSGSPLYAPAADFNRGVG